MFSAVKRHLGALGYWLFWFLAGSGVYLYLRFDTSVEGAYASVGALEWWFGGLLRSAHRYAADAFVVVVAAHIVVELAAGRFRGFRAFTWISGLPALALLYASGIVGYWLVWDARAQFSALAVAEWFDALPLLGGSMARNFLAAEAVPDRLLSLFIFLHIGLPLALLAAMWIHVQRLGQPRTVAPRSLGALAFGSLLVLAFAAPVASQARWDPLRVQALVDIDWFLQFPHPLMYATSPQALWLIAGAAMLALAALPYVARAPALIAAREDPANCNGCGRCVVDCPYEAILLTEENKARVIEDRCGACGICAGACPSSTPFRSARELVSGIDLPDATVHELRKRLQAALPAEEVVFRCEHSGAGGIALRCLAQLPPSFVEYALRHGARRVRAAGCTEECAYRLGLDLADERFAGRREPHLRSTVRVEKKDNEYSFALR